MMELFNMVHQALLCLIKTNKLLASFMETKVTILHYPIANNLEQNTVNFIVLGREEEQIVHG